MGTNDGLDADSLFNTPGFGYNFDDLVCLPGRSKSSADEVNLATRFSRNIAIANPIASSPMDSVTEAPMAIAMALLGGIGVIHCNCSAVEQARQIRKVKSFRHGFIMDPQVLSPSHTVQHIDALTRQTGVKTVLITEGGAVGNKLLGIVTSRDIDHLQDRSIALEKVMTPSANMVLARESEGAGQGLKLAEANAKLRASKKGKMPIVNDANELVAMVSRRDLKTAKEFPSASQDANKQLLVGAACTPLASPEILDRVKQLVEAGVDVLVLDSAQGSSAQQIEFVKKAKYDYPNLDIVCGNVVTPRQAKPLLDAGADGLRVGMGCSSLYSGNEVVAVGRPQASAVYHVARFCKELGSQVPVIADGGVQNSTHIAIALTLGASAVMCGSLLAATEESPGTAFFHNGMRLKNYRGVGALEAMPNSESSSSSGVDPSPTLPSESVACAVVEKGSVKSLVPFMLEAVRRDLRRLGIPNVPQLHEDLFNHNTRFHIRTPGAYGATVGAQGSTIF
jgi:IMP dehydrogenase